MRDGKHQDLTYKCLICSGLMDLALRDNEVMSSRLSILSVVLGFMRGFMVSAVNKTKEKMDTQHKQQQQQGSFNLKDTMYCAEQIEIPVDLASVS